MSHIDCLWQGGVLNFDSKVNEPVQYYWKERGIIRIRSIFLTKEHYNLSFHTQIVYEPIACHNFDLRLFRQVQCVSHIFFRSNINMYYFTQRFFWHKFVSWYWLSQVQAHWQEKSIIHIRSIPLFHN